MAKSRISNTAYKGITTVIFLTSNMHFLMLQTKSTNLTYRTVALNSIILRTMRKQKQTNIIGKHVKTGVQQSTLCYKFTQTIQINM